MLPVVLDCVKPVPGLLDMCVATLHMYIGVGMGGGMMWYFYLLATGR